MGSCAYAPGASLPRTAGSADLGAPPPYQAAPLEASPGSPRPHGHQVSTYLLSESRSWPGTPSPEPQRRSPVIRRSTAKAAQGACSSGRRRGARHTPDTLPGALARSDGSRCGKPRGPWRSAPAFAGTGPSRWAPRELHVTPGSPLTLAPNGRAGRTQGPGPANSA